MQVQAHHAPTQLPERFTTLYRSHHAFVWRCARRLGASDAEVDDVVQETFVVALRRLDEFGDGGPENPPTWLFAILRNVLRNRNRGRRRHDRKLQALASESSLRRGGQDSGHAAMGSLAHGLLGEFLATLDEERRAVYVLAELEGANSREIGEALGINSNTVRSRLRTARGAFATHFEHDSQLASSKQLLEQARDEQPSAKRRQLSLHAIAASQLGTAALAGGTGGVTAGLFAWLAKLGLSLLLVAAGLVLMHEVRASREPAVVRAFERVRAQMPPREGENLAVERSPVEPAEPERVEPEDGEAIPVTAQQLADRAVARSEPGETPAASSGSNPSEELRALEQLAKARAALVEGQPEQSLRHLLGRETWPSADLARRAVSTRVDALCSLGRSERARAAVEAWTAEFPDSPLPAPIRHACW